MKISKSPIFFTNIKANIQITTKCYLYLAIKITISEAQGRDDEYSFIILIFFIQENVQITNFWQISKQLSKSQPKAICIWQLRSLSVVLREGVSEEFSIIILMHLIQENIQITNFWQMSKSQPKEDHTSYTKYQFQNSQVVLLIGYSSGKGYSGNICTDFFE